MRDRGSFASDSEAITVIDSEPRRILAKIECGGSGPSGVAAEPSARRAYSTALFLIVAGVVSVIAGR